MLVQLIISLFGIAFVHRNLALLEKIDVLTSSKRNYFFYFLQLPFYLYLFFKELFSFILIYIGIFLLTLMLFEKIISFFREKTFETLHLHIIERLILLLKGGKSAQTSTKNVFNNLTTWQKATFNRINEIFELKMKITGEKHQISAFHEFYFRELEIILTSSSNVIEQLKSYREALRLQSNLRHKSRQAIQQSKAQAWISFFIYAVFVLLSKNYLKLELISITMLASLLLFLLGQILIFKLGGKIRWKT